jgi:DNA-binding CsgD family transcriptional regulator
VPDVIVVGLCSKAKGKAGGQTLLRLRQASPGVPIIFLPAAKDEKLLATVSALGAWEVLARRQAGPSAPNPARVATGCSPAWGPEIARLTPREMQILELIANNMSTKEVARHLDLAVKTAETHRTNLMRKLEIHSVSQLVRLAVRHKIVEV